MYNYSKLNGRIIEKYGSKDKFSRVLFYDNDWSKTRLSLKLNNKKSFSFKEIEKMIELLDIPKEQIHEYFFKKL